MILPTQIVRCPATYNNGNKNSAHSVHLNIRRLHAHNTLDVFVEMADVLLLRFSAAIVLIFFNVTRSLEKVQPAIRLNAVTLCCLLDRTSFRWWMRISIHHHSLHCRWPTVKALIFFFHFFPELLILSIVSFNWHLCINIQYIYSTKRNNLKNCYQGYSFVFNQYSYQSVRFQP